MTSVCNKTHEKSIPILLPAVGDQTQDQRNGRATPPVCQGGAPSQSVLWEAGQSDNSAALREYMIKRGMR